MVGRKVSHYQITQSLGAGGMGEIYLAQDSRLNRAVAIKVLGAAQAETDERRRRFLQEAQAASALNHPNIITIHDIVSEGDTQFMVMEFVAGKTLAELIPKGGMPIGLALDYAVQMAAALEAAHAAGIVHRDLKPRNVMVTSTGLVKVLDFGLAKWTAGITDPASLREETRTLQGAPLTVEGSIMGTVHYMSPEQAEGKPVDGRSDIFAFGAILHEMVSGERAFSGDSAISTLSSILRDDVPPLTRIPGVPATLADIADKCLRKKREDRWQSMQEVRAALAALKRESDSGTLLLVPLPPPAASRSRLPWLGAGVAGAIALAGAAGWFLTRPPAGRPAAAQPAPPPTSPPVAAVAVPAKTADDGALNNDGVVEMVRAGVPPSLIIEHIRASPTNFNLSTSEIIRLTQANVPSDVIAVMRNPAKAPNPPAAATGNATAGKTSKTAPPTGLPAPAAAPPSNLALPAASTAVRTAPSVAVAVPDGLPVAIRLAEDVAVDAPAGQPLHFTVAKDLRVGNTVVLAEGAAVTGEIVEAARKKLIGGKNIQFRLRNAVAVDGGKLEMRAMPSRKGEDSRRPLDAGAGKHSKDVAAVAGAQFVAYVDGDQKVTPRK